MGSHVDMQRLASVMRGKQGRRSLRMLAKEISGVSASTLSRIMNGKMLDVETFLRICDWLEVTPQTFIQEADNGGRHLLTVPEQIGVLLREDGLLDPETVASLIHLTTILYDAKIKEKYVGNSSETPL